MNVKHRARWDPEASPTFWVNHASRLLMREFEQRLRPLDFGMASLPVAEALKERGPLAQKQLAELSHVEQPTMAALLTRMERDGLILREPHPTDKRATLLSLSAKAKSRLPSAEEGLLEIAERALRGFTAQERTLTLTLMRRIVKNLDESRETE